ncbi:hypothetical protein AB0D13_38990 [Streptomyces sp. NPDC048430]|uniref:hypothetical protein n=1 Tax=Streptomyces sp. NPDC048430 TaxID=3155388 RepID=UPI00343AC307
MSYQPGPRSDIDGDVYVSPRYLAGTTGIGDPALAPLLDLGWELQHDDLEGVCTVSGVTPVLKAAVDD